MYNRATELVRSKVDFVKAMLVLGNCSKNTCVRRLRARFYLKQFLDDVRSFRHPLPKNKLEERILHLKWQKASLSLLERVNMAKALLLLAL